MIGNVIGNYRIERELGEGGMSHVYVGRTVSGTDVLPEGYLVVLKVMADELAGEVTARKRFIKEAQILSQLRHRYITRFFEFISRDSGAVLVMEFVDGDPVDRIIHEKGALPIPDAIAVAQCLLEALVYAHGKGIVHRDIKPANLIEQRTGGVKVTDFGIAKIKEGSQGSQTVLTKSGFLLGTPHYMSPEQIREPKDAGASADIYSSAVVLYEMLTGTLPFNHRSLPKLIDAVYRGDKSRPKELRPDIPDELDNIVLKAMHPEAQSRFESARHFYEALEEHTARSPVGARPAVSDVLETIDANDDTAMLRADQRPQIQWQLISARDNGKETHEIKGESIMVGRDRTCSIVLVHPAVSRRHARITIAGDTFTLEDLKSANGTFVNNTRVDKANIKPGDVVRFGADPTCSYVVRAR